ncbi:MAG: hypothetical protein AAF483_30090 [Planctomycetota bacterium]
MQCPFCNTLIADNSQYCPACQAPLSNQAQTADPNEYLDASAKQQQSNPYAVNQAPIHNVQMAPIPPENRGDETGGIIPYKNPRALIAYYLGILSGFPFIGLPLGIAAFVLGLMGLRDRKRNPVIKGAFHAWVGIGCGGIFTLFWAFGTVVLIIALTVR